MTLQELMIAVNEELRGMIFPKCNTFEKVVVGVALAGLNYKVGQLVAGNAEMVSGLKLVDNDGNVDLPLVEYALKNGIQWPLAVGPFTFTEADFEVILNNVKERYGVK